MTPNISVDPKNLCASKKMITIMKIKGGTTHRGQALIGTRKAYLTGEFVTVDVLYCLTNSPSLAPYGTKRYNLRVEYILCSLSTLLYAFIGSVTMLKWSRP